MTVYVQPDVDAALVVYLTAHPALAPLHSGRVGTRLAPGSAPAVRTSSLGGAYAWPWESTPEFQIEWWGGDQAAASRLARTGEAALYGLLGPITGGWITALDIPLSMLWSPDETSGRARYLTQVQLTVNPEGST
ncbi:MULTISPECIES: hypothetical protein [Catenuloplanes]|uniref:Uncharacterized protein n=1 Tax=Catenuloplanes niger TaxID=587534 RepID=A0AAE3ZP49_9ACTN|nr:hypothetical protein [Catenuloplanes niger]MDR7323377.1 hypothetical protein [Catenuloplanes niger]